MHVSYICTYCIDADCDDFGECEEFALGKYGEMWKYNLCCRFFALFARRQQDMLDKLDQIKNIRSGEKGAFA